MSQQIHIKRFDLRAAIALANSDRNPGEYILISAKIFDETRNPIEIARDRIKNLERPKFEEEPADEWTKAGAAAMPPPPIEPSQPPVDARKEELVESIQGLLKICERLVKHD